MTKRVALLYGLMCLVLIAIGFLQSWNVAFGIFNLCVISAVMALGVNMQWGYAGLFNVGVMGFTALGGLTAVLVSMPPVGEAWAVAGGDIALSLLSLAATIVAVIYARRFVHPALKLPVTLVLLLAGYFLIGVFFGPATDAIESIDPALSGYLGGAGLPVLVAWPLAGLVAAGGGWLIGRIALGLRADYLAIATLGISEIIIAIIKYEEWLSRGVKNVTGIPRPVPYEVDLIESEWFISLANFFGAAEISDAASLFVKLCYAVLFVIVLAIIMWFAERALKSPWGRMMRAIRDNRDAAAAMGKDVKRRHLQTFVLGCAVCGIAGAMLTTLDGQLTPTSYIPLRYTFLIWVMVILGGSGNNWGSILGGFIIWFLWVEAEPFGNWFMSTITAPLGEGSELAQHLVAGAAYMRYLMMGAILLIVMRFAPKGLIPEATNRSTAMTRSS
ncbi:MULTISPECIES: branched-chain amino acid ABC transporter permease [unclassified Thalassospira]|uniref:branched-chain amino acid ABC transporter permease n=1 Tax=unclassified Thalassospira TaxID=2648997 RepID=UPI0007A5D5CC|nr:MULTISPECIES: branched-chain amino acid ABC transporter permease [unclassified Thalassospira]KZC99674.1 branched-chain amino acid ABC transporter permease [Thalassospira sp. MCCC 1A02898]ONH85401.1 branched-chain amino acid ABC transporter permease [Thalassospira sp. MCCC 1A02803]